LYYDNPKQNVSQDKQKFWHCFSLHKLDIYDLTSTAAHAKVYNIAGKYIK